MPWLELGLLAIVVGAIVYAVRSARSSGRKDVHLENAEDRADAATHMSKRTKARNARERARRYLARRKRLYGDEDQR